MYITIKSLWERYKNKFARMTGHNWKTVAQRIKEIEERGILKPDCRPIKISRTLIFPFSLLSINVLSMIALPVTLLLKRETSSLSVTRVPVIIESFCLWKK